MRYVWDEDAWSDSLQWQTEDRRVLRRINELLKDIARNGDGGIGGPEALKHGFHGYRSRRITQEHRLVYRIGQAAQDGSRSIGIPGQTAI